MFKSTQFIASAVAASLLVFTQVASAHPGHEGHGLAPQAPLGSITVITLAAHIAAAGVWVMARRAQKKRR
jgi:hypothetical protein